MRLFIAIQFTPEILDALTGIQDDLRSLGVTGNYTRRENLHLTLAFIGDYGNPEEVLDAMAQADFCPFTLTLGGVGAFREVFWAGIEDSPALMAYTRRLRRALSDAGIPFDRKKFLPHITLIRGFSYMGTEPVPVSERVRVEMLVERISLMKSERGKNGMIYTELGYI